MMKYMMGRLSLTASMAMALIAVAPAQTYDVAKLRVALEEKAKAVFQGSRAPGINLAVLMPDNRWVRVSAGYRTLNPDEPIRLNDRMPAGSVGKMFFATAILQQVQAGRLNLDTPIAQYVSDEPWFEGLPNASSLTLRNLMNHTSGIPEHVLDPAFIAELKADPDKVWGHSELLKFTKGKPALFPAGQRWSYADTNYIVAALVMEKVTQRDAFGEITQRVLRPFKLETTSPSDDRVLDNLATGYSMPNSPFGFTGPVVVDGKMVMNPQMEWAGGGFISTPLDLSRFAKLLYEGRIISKAMIAEATNGVAIAPNSPRKYGLATQIHPSPWGPTWGHSGWFPGYLTDVRYFPGHEVSIAVQVNTDDVNALKRSPERLVLEIAEVVFGPSGLNKKPVP